MEFNIWYSVSLKSVTEILLREIDHHIAGVVEVDFLPHGICIVIVVTVAPVLNLVEVGRLAAAVCEVVQ